MKHTLPAVALVAAASAQTAPASGLNYDLLTISRHQRQNAVAVQATLKDTDFLVGAATSNNNWNSGPNNWGYGDATRGQISLGYVFKNVTNGIDATVGVIQTNGDSSIYSVVLRRQLNEVYQGLEISVGYAGALSSANRFNGSFVFGGTSAEGAQSISYVELAYNINKTFALAVGLVNPGRTAGYFSSDRATVFSVRAGF